MNAAFTRSMLCALLLAGIPALGAAADAPVPQTAGNSRTPVLSRAQVDALLAKPEQIVLIDLRRPDEHQFKGAFPVFLSIQAETLEKYLAYIPRDRQVLAVSNHVRRSGQAADLLVSHGFKVAGVVGAQLYEEQGGQLNKVPAPVAKP